MRNSYKLNWFYEYNIQEVNRMKILFKYTFTHLLCLVIVRNMLFWQNKSPKLLTMTDDWSLFATLPGSKIYIRRFSNHLSMSVALTFSSWFQCFLCHTCTESYHMKSFQQSIKMMGKLKYFLKTSKVYKIRHTYTHWLR